jgi:hypothetical protein
VVTLGQFLAKLREFMNFDQRPVLLHNGSVSTAEAKRKASREIKEYQAKLRADKEAEGEAALSALTGAATSIEPAKSRKKKV